MNHFELAISQIDHIAVGEYPRWFDWMQFVILGLPIGTGRFAAFAPAHEAACLVAVTAFKSICFGGVDCHLLELMQTTGMIKVHVRRDSQVWFTVGFANADAALLVVGVAIGTARSTLTCCIDQILSTQKRRQIPKTDAGVDNEIFPCSMDDVYVGDVPGIVVPFTNLRYAMMREFFEDDKVMVVVVGAGAEGIFFIFVGRGAGGSGG